MNLYNIPKYLIKIVKSFITDRKFLVSINGSHSDIKNITAGLPQGSVLSPLLYSIFISDFKKPKNCDTMFYADDTGLTTDGKLTKTIIKKLQSGYKCCRKYLHKWKIKLNDEKTQAIIFPFNKSPKRYPRTNLNIGNLEVSFTNTVTYLGVTLDKNLSFGKHIEKTRNKALKCGRSLYPLLAPNSKLSHINKNVIYKSIIRPIMTYGCPVWSGAARTHIKKLQIIQNKQLKLINGLPWRFSTHQLHVNTGYQTIEDYMKKLVEKFQLRCMDSEFQLIRDLVDGREV